MTTVALIVFPPEAEVSPFEKVCGIPLILRHLLVLREAEVRDALVVGELGEEEKSLWLEAERKIGVKARCFEADQASELSEALGRFRRVLVIDGRYGFESMLLKAALRAGETKALVDGDSEQPEGTPRVRIGDGSVEEISPYVQGPYFAGVALLPVESLRRSLRAGVRPDDPEGIVTAGAPEIVDIAEVSPYDPERRRPVKPTWRFLSSRAEIPRLRKALVGGTQKRTLDVMAWYVHRHIENFLTYLLAETPLTPNQMTVITFLVALCVAALFASGHLLAGALLALAVNVMDGLDGKLARAKAMTTKVGLLEHSLDLFYEQSWYIAYSYAAWKASGGRTSVVVALLGVLLFDSFARHIYMQFRQATGVSLSDVAPFDRAFRRFDGRRNIYSLYILGGAIAHIPWFAVYVMAFHAFVTAAVYFVRAAKHLRNIDLGKSKAP